MHADSRLLDVFDDLEQQADGLARAERETEVADAVSTEYAQVTLASRLRAGVGHEVALHLGGELRLRGRIARVGEEWLVLGESGVGDGVGWLVATDALLTVSGLGPRARHTATVSIADTLPMRSLVRRLAEDAGRCQVHLRDGSRLDGRLGRVGQDFVELAVPGAQAHAIPLRAVAAVRWSAW